MQIYRAFMKLLNKNIPSISIYFVVFIILCISITKISPKQTQESFTQTELSIFAENKDEGILGTALLDYLGQTNNILPMPKDTDSLLDRIYNREADYVLQIPKDFTSRFTSKDRENILISKKIPSSAMGMLADTQVNQYLSAISIYSDSGFSVEESIEEAKKDLQLSISASLINNENNAEEPASFYFRYLPYILLSIMILSIGTILMVFQRKEIKDRNRCSPIPASMQTIQVLLGCMILSVIVFAVFAMIAFIMYPDYMFGWKGILSLCNVAVFLGISLVIACLVGHLSKNSSAISMMGNVIGLALSFLGGVFVPLILFDQSVITIAKFTPTYWYITANEAIQKVSTLQDISPDIYIGFLVQGGFILAILSIVMVIDKKV